MKKLVALTALGVGLALAGCSSSITEPAAPATPLTADATPTPSESSEPDPVRNPYEAGATRDWSIEPTGEPSAIAYDRQSGTVVVVVESRSGTVLEAFQVTNSGRTLPVWNHEIADGARVGAIDAASGLVFVQVGSADNPDDLLIIRARNGVEELRWSRAHALDTDVPALVGAYDSGGGITKLSRDSVLGAIVDSTGETVDDERLFMLHAPTDQLTIGRDIVNTHLVSDAGVAFITFPELSVVFGDECWSAVDGIVCVGAGAEAGQGAGAEPSQGAGIEAGQDAGAEVSEAGSRAVFEYDRRGAILSVTPIGQHSAAMHYLPVAFNADVTAGELAGALAEDIRPGEGGTSQKPSAENSATEDPATGEPANRIPAILHDGDWITDLPQLAGGEAEEPGEKVEGAVVEDGITPLERGAPFVYAGKKLVNAAAGGGLVVDGQEVAAGILAGAGTSADMFFEWDGTALHYLKPRG